MHDPDFYRALVQAAQRPPSAPCQECKAQPGVKAYFGLWLCALCWLEREMARKAGRVFKESRHAPQHSTKG